METLSGNVEAKVPDEPNKKETDYKCWKESDLPLTKWCSENKGRSAYQTLKKYIESHHPEDIHLIGKNKANNTTNERDNLHYKTLYEELQNNYSKLKDHYLELLMKH